MKTMNQKLTFLNYKYYQLKLIELYRKFLVKVGNFKEIVLLYLPTIFYDIMVYYIIV